MKESINIDRMEKELEEQGIKMREVSNYKKTKDFLLKLLFLMIGFTMGCALLSFFA